MSQIKEFLKILGEAYLVVLRIPFAVFLDIDLEKKYSDKDKIITAILTITIVFILDFLFVWWLV